LERGEFKSEISLGFDPAARLGFLLYFVLFQALAIDYDPVGDGVPQKKKFTF
jgi:hypothetical protein